jgi:cell division protease FtsH
LGLVLSLPERDHLSQTRQMLTSKIAMAMGGRVAEELVFGEEQVTNGAASDIQQVTRIARAMVTQFGMSDELGAIDYANERESFLGLQQGPGNVSQATQEKIDAEVRRLVDTGYQEARRILAEKRDDLERLAQGLLEYETLTGDEIRKVLAGEALDRSDDAGMPPPSDTGKPRLSAVPKVRKPRSDEGGDLSPQPH